MQLGADQLPGLSRLHAHRPGRVLFAGLAVGESDTPAVRAHPGERALLGELFSGSPM